MMITRTYKIRMTLIHSDFREMRRQSSVRDHLSAVHNLAVSSDDYALVWYRDRALHQLFTDNDTIRDGGNTAL